MRRLLFPLRICCIVLATLACAVRPSMTKDDFYDRGVSILLPDDPAYGAELEKLGFQASPSPYSAIIKNTSRRGIVAFGLRFTKQFANGHTAASDVAGTEPSALIDQGQPTRHDKTYRALVISGGSRLVTPEEGIIDSSTGLASGRTSFQTRLSWIITKVELDSVVFDDGEAIGPDHLDLIKRLRAQVDAQQVLVEEISARLAKGELLGGVLHDIAASSAAVFSKHMVSATADQAYGAVRLRYITELSKTEANAGEEAAIRRLRQLEYTIRPQIRQQGEN
jgi:hypothetical protein